VDETNEAVEAAFAEIAARREAAATHEHAQKSLWLAHHWPERYDRCMVIGGRHVCRRCTVFYSISFLVAALAFAGIAPWPESFDIWAVWLTPIPATIEFALGEMTKLQYSARRQVIVTAFMSPAVGRGMAAELSDQGSWLFWGPVLVYGTSWFIFALVGWFTRKGQYRSAEEPVLDS